MQTNRHHQLKGKLKGFWEYEVGGGARVRYKRGPNDHVQGPTQVTEAGLEIPIPTREDFLRNVEKVAPKPVPVDDERDSDTP